MAERVFYLLTYDIADPKRLAKVAKAMESAAERVQDSVFEAYLNDAELEALLKKIKKALNEEDDSLRIYLLCASCKDKIRFVGQGKPTPPPGTMIV